MQIIDVIELNTVYNSWIFFKIIIIIVKHFLVEFATMVIWL